MDKRTLLTAAKLGRSHGLEIIGTLQKPIKIAELRALLRKAIGDPGQARSQEIQDALERTEFVVYYQPKIRRLHGKWIIDGAEALVRWQHRSLGLLMPAEFLQAAEEAGLIGQLTDYVLSTGIRQISSWAKLGFDLGVAVNLSARLLDDLDFPDRCRVLLADHGVHGSKLTLELTESAAMSDPTLAMDVFLRLRMCDVGLSIDDFGTGFSSLQQLYQLPFDELKIDKAFTLCLPRDDEARAIVRAMIEMAHALDMRVCAEGVETQAALDYLETLACDQAQGFLISPAVPAKEFETLVGRWGRRVPWR
jgi:EAL domain-containing protein (putative c-di-GMP-specific phosphodiesterase class I)